MYVVKKEKRLNKLFALLFLVFAMAGSFGVQKAEAATKEEAKEDVAIITGVYYSENKIYVNCESKLVDGVEVQIAEDKRFTKNVKTIKHDSMDFAYTFKNDADAVFKNIKVGKIYYIRARGYEELDYDLGDDVYEEGDVYGSYSKTVSIKPTTVNKVTDLKITNPKKGQLTVSWKKVPVPKGFKKIFYVVGIREDKECRVGEFDDWEVWDENTVTFKEKKLKKGQTYYVFIYAYCTPQNKLLDDKKVCVANKSKKIVKKIKITK